MPQTVDQLFQTKLKRVGCILESFNSSFEEQQRVQQKAFLKTLQEIQKSTNQELAKQQAQFQVFLEESKEQIIQAVRTPYVCFDPDWTCWFWDDW